MYHDVNHHKTLRNYRKHQEKARKQVKGVDYEDWSLLQIADTAGPEQALWRAVILQMITDAISNSHKPDQKRFRRDARHWLTRDSRDFRLVCEYAGYQPDWLKGEITRFFAIHDGIAPQPLAKEQPVKTFKAASQFSIHYTFNGLVPSHEEA